MERTHWGQHQDCFGCKLQSLQFDPYAMPSRLNPSRAPKKPENSWEKGIATDRRGMPILDKTGAPMSVKAYGENRHRIEEHRKKLHQAQPEPSTRS